MQAEQGVTSEPGGMAQGGGVGAASLAGELAEARAGEQPVGGGEQDVGASQPVGGGEGLGAEGVSAVDTAESGDALRGGPPREPAVSNPAPADRGTVEPAITSRTVRGHEPGA